MSAVKKKHTNYMDNIEKFLILKPVLEKVTDGGMFRFMFSWFFRLMALGALFGTVYSSWKLWGNIDSKMPAKYFVGGIIIQLFLLGIGFIVINILLIRSNDLYHIPSTKDYSVTPIIVLFWKTIGEIVASVYVVLGFAMGLAYFVAGARILNYIPFSMPGMESNSGSPGLVFIFVGALMGFLVLFLFYYIAELMAAVVDTARNTSVLVNNQTKKSRN